MSSSLNMVLETAFHEQTSSSQRRSLNHFLATEKGCRTWRGHLALTDFYSLLVEDYIGPWPSKIITNLKTLMLQFIIYLCLIMDKILELNISYQAGYKFSLL